VDDGARIPEFAQAPVAVFWLTTRAFAHQHWNWVGYTRRLCPLGDGERINLFRTLAIGERVGNAGPDLFPFADEEVLSCAISAMRKQWHARCAMP
jgi:hypothetical protein